MHQLLKRVSAVRWGLWVVCLPLLLTAGPAAADTTTIPPEWRFRANAQLNAVFKRETGTPISWTVAADGSISSSPLISEGVAYVATNGKSVYAIDLSDGSIRWRYRGDDEIMTQPLRVDGTIIIGTGNAQVVGYRATQYIVLGTGNNEIVGLSKMDGNAIWSLGLPGTGMPTGIVVDGTYYHIDGSGLLFALDAHNGGYIWRKDVQSTVFMSAINYSHGYFIAAGNWPNRVFAFDADGRELWSHSFNSLDSGFSDAPLAIAGNYVVSDYVSNADPKKFADDLQPGVEHVYALRRDNGQLIWDEALEGGIVPPYNMSSIPVIDGDTVVVGSALTPYEHAFDLRTGRLLWQTRVGGPVKGAASIVGGVVYLGDLKGYLWALDERAGSPIGAKHFADGFNVGSGVIARDSLIIGGTSGKIYAIPLAEIRGARDYPQTGVLR